MKKEREKGSRKLKLQVVGSDHAMTLYSEKKAGANAALGNDRVDMIMLEERMYGNKDVSMAQAHMRQRSKRCKFSTLCKSRNNPKRQNYGIGPSGQRSYRNKGKFLSMGM